MKHHSSDCRCADETQPQIASVLISACESRTWAGGRFGAISLSTFAKSWKAFALTHGNEHQKAEPTYLHASRRCATCSEIRGRQSQNENTAIAMSARWRWFAAIGLTVTLGLTGAFASEPMQQPKPKTDEVLMDFQGRRLPAIARKLVDQEKPAVLPGRKPAPMPGWEYIDGKDTPAFELEGNPRATLSNAGLTIDDIFKKGYRVGVIRRIHPDKSWRVLDVYARTRREVTTELCDNRGHEIPDGHLLLGIMHQADPHYPPTPPRPTLADLFEHQKTHLGEIYPPRYCLGDTQRARTAALLNLTTGKLVRYSAKPVNCVSPFFEPCPAD